MILWWYYSAMERKNATPNPQAGVGFLLSQLGWNQARLFQETVEPFGLDDPREFVVLRALAASDGASQKEVCVSLGITPSRMVALMDALEDKGLVERGQNARDRRARAVHITDAGRETLGRAIDALTKAERWLCEPLQAQERDALLGLLTRIADHVGLARDFHPARAMSWPWPETEPRTA